MRKCAKISTNKVTLNKKIDKIIIITLAISDSLFLTLTLPETLSIAFFDFEFWNIYKIGCKYIAFVNFFFPAVSAWLVAILNFERCCAVILPLRMKVIASKRNLAIKQAGLT